jgi:hypothetical protein
MKQVILNIPESKYPFFMELVKKLAFVKDTYGTELNKKSLWTGLKNLSNRLSNT